MVDFYSAVQLPPGFHSDFFSLSYRMIAEGDDNDLLYHSLLRGSKKVPCVTSRLLAEYFNFQQ